jgi:hypothetical protein
MTTSNYTDVQRAEALFLWDLGYPEGSKGAIAKVLGLNNGQTVNGFVMAYEGGGLQNLPEVPEARKAELMATYRKQLGLPPLPEVAAELLHAAGGELDVVDVNAVDWASAVVTVLGPDGQPVQILPPFSVADLIRSTVSNGQDLAEARVALADERNQHANDMRAVIEQAAAEKAAMRKELDARDNEMKALEEKLATAEANTRRYRAVAMVEMSTNGSSLQPA